MGKGGGCVPSKKRSPVDDKDYDHQTSDDVTQTVRKNHSIETASNEVKAVKKLRIFIVFYSMYGHVELLARRMKKGVDSIDGVEGVLYRVPETLSMEVLEQMRVPNKSDDVPFVCMEDLVLAHGLLFGFPTRFGSMAAQMKAFFDSTVPLWKAQSLAGVPAGFFVCTGTQGGGQETTA